MDKNKVVPRRIVVLLHDVKADDTSFRRALDTQVAAIEAACADLTQHIRATCPVVRLVPDDPNAEPTEHVCDVATDLFIRDGQLIFEGPQWRPKLVVLARNKSNVRMYPAQNARDAIRDKKGNVPAGTCLHDYVPITSGSEEQAYAKGRDSFLIAPQAGLMGTKRVSAYHCLRNDEGVPLDTVLAPLVNTLTHCYGRCPRAISLPSPLANALRG